MEHKDLESCERNPHWMRAGYVEEIYRFNLETAVRDSKVMQDFKSESFERGDTHSRLVKGSPSSNDSGSKDCVNLPSPTAVSRFNPIYQKP